MVTSPNTVLVTSPIPVRETLLPYITPNADQLSLHRLIGTALLRKEYGGVYVDAGSAVLPREVFGDEVGVPLSGGLGGVLPLSADAGLSWLGE
jgi:hypothetical protein